MVNQQAFACPIGHPLLRPYRRSEGCRACRAEATLSAAGRLLIEAVPSLDFDDARQLVDRAGGSGLGRNELHAWLSHPDAVHSGRSDCPRSGVRLLELLIERGIAVELPKCIDCGFARTLGAKVDGGRVCNSCYRHRHQETCGTCGGLKRVAARDDTGRAGVPGLPRD